MPRVRSMRWKIVCSSKADGSKAWIKGMDQRDGSLTAQSFGLESEWLWTRIEQRSRRRLMVWWQEVTVAWSGKSFGTELAEV